MKLCCGTKYAEFSYIFLYYMVYSYVDIYMYIRIGKYILKTIVLLLPINHQIMRSNFKYFILKIIRNTEVGFYIKQLSDT